MHISRPVVASSLALAAMAAVGVASGQAEAPDHAPLVVEATDVAPAALPSLTLRVGEYMERRVSDYVTPPPGASIQFRGLPPGLSYDPATTAIRGTPTVAGVYEPVATAFIFGVPVRTETTTVTVTGGAGGTTGGTGGGGAPAPRPAQAPAPAPAPVAAPVAPPAPGTITIADIDTLPVPEQVKDALRGAALALNNGIQSAWNAVPEGSLGK
ncbi:MULTISPECIES: hypothetical protein [Dietzia]|jgi:hypothetical protein|uniref:Uncharacterized protein n=1 Tax=Dietzia maris TaxID=37915 RepID=A0ABT8H1Z4_9ACTN|nr:MULTISPECIES: hypothetical protein [Dietzia]MCZ4539412.1 hypothetical protein [Dietzia maris]MCZ4656123.1 hypothetical protein [Dietzia kunjamensis]MDJ0422632.1 hypothetical protein [Dietzia kunjamensis]MDN4506482.1 hypothetical protein [Dietzia maris]MDV3354614.1 hypothetical protein [Dietzia sp. IN118]